MTTPIMNVLDIAQQPPYLLGWQELDKFSRAITAIYEQNPKADREELLLDDYMSLYMRHKLVKVEREGIANNNPIRLFPNRSDNDLKNIQGSIEEIARLLLSVADSLNTRLSESFIEQCQKSTEESASRFYEIIREAYITPSWKTEKKADSSAAGTGMGNNATTNPQTPPAAKETPNEWLSGKPKEVLDEAVNCGLAEKKEDGYYWIIGNKEKGWQVGLYGYFVFMVSEQLGWRTGKANRIPWSKFKPIFKNHKELLGTAKQTVDDFKKGNGVPTLYYKVDDLIRIVFDVVLSPTPKSL